MPLAPVVYCGFADVMVHLEVENVEQLRVYNQEMESFKKMIIDEKRWIKDRKTLRSYIQNSKYFDGQAGALAYKERFKREVWYSLKDHEMAMHSYRMCTGCTKIPEFGLKKHNKEFVAKMGQVQCIKKAQETTPFSSKKIVKFARDTQMSRNIESDLHAVYSTNISMKKWSDIRRRQYGEYVEHNVKSHAGGLHLYTFDRELAERRLRAAAEGTDLSCMEGDWSALAREVKLRRTGELVYNDTLNGTQILKKFATELGYECTLQKRKRVSWRKDEHGLASFRSTAAKRLITERDKMISNGEVDLGDRICPVQSKRLRIDNSGETVEELLKYSGRCISLQKIREKHLEEMEAKKVLRRTNCAVLSREQVEEILNRNDVSYNDHDDTDTLRARVLELETTRHMVIWEDHSDIGGHTHYVIHVWFLYDQGVFLTSKEAGFDVQSMVERPYLHMIGRSKSSVAHQLQYVPERVEQLKTMNKPIVLCGRQYTDVIRFNSADLPARQYESGHSGGGNWPCPCGININKVSNPDNVLMRGPYYSIADRTTAFHRTKLKPDADTDSLKKHETEKVAMLLRLKLSFREDVATLRQLIKKELKGLKRMPPILTQGHTLKQLNCERYEVAYCEPLHDLKNLIMVTLEELPHIILDKDLKAEVQQFIKTALGERTMMRGSDARLQLIHITRKFEAIKLQMDRQCKAIHSVLQALCEIQRLAYQQAEKRCPRDILHMHLMCLLFSTGYADIFCNPKQNTIRKVFGAPFHAVAVHFAEVYRMVSLSSIVAEKAERLFHDMREMTKASNKKEENILDNVMVRMHFKQKLECSESTISNEQQQQNQISRSARNLNRVSRTILTKSFIDKHKVPVLYTLKLVADYLDMGHGTWFEVINGNIMFIDGYEDPETQGGMTIYHYRSSSASAIAANLEDAWRRCCSRPDELRLDILQQ